ncbi:hypothetical protein FOPG_00243 [Fusarium oxysporum f. sp. conglutinans race 2 54008]|uniref:Uncharacterized protein n=1 Tax=Fusarium oxysporum f. sp. conglutinans race 2 54008 TaxID=1089457 RepID=X0J038_FUSOX|nr:hypothetical protein FOPG_00243 [Fusarium oxysporum f. sp. conglutinans race 2 54008]
MSPADDQATGTGAAIGPQLQKLGKKSEWRLYLDASEPRSLHVRDPEPVMRDQLNHELERKEVIQSAEGDSIWNK